MCWVRAAASTFPLELVRDGMGINEGECGGEESSVDSIPRQRSLACRDGVFTSAPSMIMIGVSTAGSGFLGGLSTSGGFTLISSGTYGLSCGEHRMASGQGHTFLVIQG